VNFYDNGKPLSGGQGIPLDTTSGIAAFGTEGLTAGMHVVTAVYSGDAKFQGSTSNSVTVQVAGYAPNPNGYGFTNPSLPTSDGAQGSDYLGYDTMVSDYPATNWFHNLGPLSSHTFSGQQFHDNVFVPFLANGQCYGVAASSAYFYNDSPLKPLNLPLLFGSADPSNRQNNVILPFPFDGKNNVQLMTLIQRYHSRQLADFGALSATDDYLEVLGGGNLPVFQQLAGMDLKDHPITLSIAPSKSVTDPSRWYTLFNESHVVVAYGTGTNAQGQETVNVYDPNAPLDESAVLTLDNVGNLKLTYAEGTQGEYGTGSHDRRDWGQPSEWQMVPLPDAVWSDNSSLVTSPIGTFTADNQHAIWELGDIAFVAGAVSSVIPKFPLIIMSGVGTPGVVQMIPSGSTFTSTEQAVQDNSSMGLFNAGHVAVITQTDVGASGSTHTASIDPKATGIHISQTSSNQHFTATLGADYTSGNYGRGFTVTGVDVPQSKQVDITTDAATDALTLDSTGSSQAVSVTLSQVGASSGTATVQAVIPAKGASATIAVANWSDLAHSLIYETYASGGTTTLRILQDNPVQRQALVSTLFANANSVIGTISDDRVADRLHRSLAVVQEQYNQGLQAQNPFLAYIHFFVAEIFTDEFRDEVYDLRTNQIPVQTRTQLKSIADQLDTLIARQAVPPHPNGGRNEDHHGGHDVQRH
jgi:hypothetical protein